LFSLATLFEIGLNFLVRLDFIMNRVRIFALVRVNRIRFLISIFLLQLAAELTTLPRLRPVVHLTFFAIPLPLRAHTNFASTTICIILLGV